MFETTHAAVLAAVSGLQRSAPAGGFPKGFSIERWCDKAGNLGG